MTNGFTKASKVASSPPQLSDPVHVVRRPTGDKFDTCTHELNWHFNCPAKIIQKSKAQLC